MKTFSYTAHSKQVLGDMHTPVSIYLKVRDMYPQSALMESSDIMQEKTPSRSSLFVRWQVSVSIAE